MKKIQKHIEIVRSSVVWLSSLSLESCDAIVTLLSQHYASVGVSTVNTSEDLDDLLALKPDLVFLGMKYIPTRVPSTNHGSPKIWIADFLDLHGIAHTGSGSIAHELELNKPLAKQRAQMAGLSTSKFCVIAQGEQKLFSSSLSFPVFIKPTNRGGGLGIDSNSVAHSVAQMQAKVSSIAAEHGSDSLIEEYLPGREFSVAILKDKISDTYTAMPIELIAQPDSKGICVLSEQVKSANAETAIAVADPILKAQVAKLALDVFTALGAQDYGRIDIRLDERGVPHFLEANLIPSLISGYGSFPKACVLNAGIDYQTMILTITQLGLSRSAAVLEDEVPSVESKELIELA